MASLRKSFKYTFGNKEHQAIRAKANNKSVRCKESGLVYESIRAAGRALKLNSNRISECAKGLIDAVGDLSFEFVKN